MGKSYQYVNLLHLFKILLLNFCFLSNDLVSAATWLYWKTYPTFGYFLQQLISTLTIHFRIWEKATNIIKVVNNELICNKKYLKAEKRFNTKESLQCFYIPVNLFVSVYKEIEAIIQKCLWKNLFITILEKYNKFCFLGLWKFFLKVISSTLTFP